MLVDWGAPGQGVLRRAAPQLLDALDEVSEALHP